MSHVRCSIDATSLGQIERIERIERQGRQWRLVALICASVLGAVLILGQSGTSQEAVAGARAEDAPPPEAGSATTTTWEYEVLRFPARPSRTIRQDATRYLTDELNAGAANGWEYIGLLALESQPAGYNGLVAFRREKDVAPQNADPR